MINTIKHLAYILKVDVKEIDFIVRNIDKFYYEDVEIKYNKHGMPKIKNGVVQKRVLNPSIKRLKVIQRRILRNVLQKLPMPDYAFGGIRNKDNIQNGRMHQGKKFIFTTDLRNFFPSINHHNVFEMYISFGFSPTVARCLTQLTTYKGKIPQGARTSSMVANLVFIKTGTKLQDFATQHGLTFTSFVDDLTFSAAEDFKEKAQQLIEMIVADGFKISHNKTNYKTKFPVVTGTVPKNNGMDTTQEFKEKHKKLDEFNEKQVEGLIMYQSRVEASSKRKVHKRFTKSLRATA